MEKDITKKLKEGDKVRMRDDTPEYKTQGFNPDGTPKEGIVSNDYGDCSLCYGVRWLSKDGVYGTAYGYSDKHVELLIPKEEIVNTYSIF